MEGCGKRHKTAQNTEQCSAKIVIQPNISNRRENDDANLTAPNQNVSPSPAGVFFKGEKTTRMFSEEKKHYIYVISSPRTQAFIHFP